MKRGQPLPQHLHIMPKGHSSTRACGAIEGGFVRARDVAWLKKFLKNGGGLCAQCKKTPAGVELLKEAS